MTTMVTDGRPGARTNEANVPATDAEAGPNVSLADAARAVGVTYGPSVLLDLFVGASIATLIGEWLGWRTSCPLVRTLRSVAGLAAAATAVYLVAGRPRLRRWGATDDEIQRALPGDELVPEPAIEATWAVTIDASVETVWPWLAQVGQDRGGFYSYEWLENLAGCKMRNADRIHPEWRQRAVGETIRLHPATGLKVARFEPNRALVMDGWGSFVLEPIDGRRTRLISRSRVPRGWAALTYALLLEIPHFVMQRKMLLGIKARAERQARQQRDAHMDDEAPAQGAGKDASLRRCHRKVTIVDTSRCPREASLHLARET
jgi:hypothetical protein